MIELKQYRDRWLAEKVDEYIGFYNREFFCLDNFSSFGIEYNGKYYATVEHAYQSGKFFQSDLALAEEIRLATSAHHAKNIARDNKDKGDVKFDEYKVSFMEELLRLKMAQHPYVVRKLLETENYPICEDSISDTFWGIGRERNGMNHLGKLWMKLRAELNSTKELTFILGENNKKLYAGYPDSKTCATMMLQKGATNWAEADYAIVQYAADTNNHFITPEKAREFYGNIVPDMKLLNELENRRITEHLEMEELKTKLFKK